MKFVLPLLAAPQKLPHATQQRLLEHNLAHIPTRSLQKAIQGFIFPVRVGSWVSVETSAMHKVKKKVVFRLENTKRSHQRNMTNVRSKCLLNR